ncbi:hypothetical protein ACWCYK_08370 [Streptomyces lydicamycinicus]
MDFTVGCSTFFDGAAPDGALTPDDVRRGRGLPGGAKNLPPGPRPARRRASAHALEQLLHGLDPVAQLGQLRAHRLLLGGDPLREPAVLGERRGLRAVAGP